VQIELKVISLFFNLRRLDHCTPLPGAMSHPPYKTKPCSEEAAGRGCKKAPFSALLIFEQ